MRASNETITSALPLLWSKFHSSIPLTLLLAGYTAQFVARVEGSETPRCPEKLPINMDGININSIRLGVSYLLNLQKKKLKWGRRGKTSNFLELRASAEYE